jgi:hypothetical protein
MQRRIVILILSVLVISGSTGCEAQRLVEARVERDGEPILQSQFGISDEATPATAWGLLSDQKFKAVGHVAPEENDPKKAVLKGKIRIFIRYAGSHLARVDVEQLRIVLVPGTEDYWTIPKDEVERTLKAAGL